MLLDFILFILWYTTNILYEVLSGAVVTVIIIVWYLDL